MNLQQLFDNYKIARSMEKSTVISYQATVNIFNRWLASHDLAGIEVDDIDIDLINAFLTEYANDVAEPTSNSKRRILIALMNFHLEPKRETINSRFIKRRKTRDTRRTTWQPHEIRRMIQFAKYLPGELACGTSKADYFHCLLSLAWETAARRGDLTRITVEDIRSEKPFLFVQHKTKQGVVYRVSPETRRAILAMPHVQTARLVFPAWGPSGCQQWQLEAITKTTRAVMLAAGLSAFDGCLKKIRRSAITRAEELKPGAGFRFAGHRSPQTTIDSYLDPTRTLCPEVNLKSV